MRARGRRGRAWRPAASTTGTPKAMVLPEPVGARPQRSRPGRASGMVAAWIGKAWSIPRAPRLRTIQGGTPRSENRGPVTRRSRVGPVAGRGAAAVEAGEDEVRDTMLQWWRALARVSRTVSGGK